MRNNNYDNYAVCGTIKVTTAVFFSSRQALLSEERNKIAVESSTRVNNNHLNARVQRQNGYNIKNQDNLK